MIPDRRQDTLTPRLKELRSFEDAIPALFEAARAGDAQLALLTRQAVRDVQHYICPIGQQLGKSWLFVVSQKLESPNRFRAHWSLQNGAREKWEKQLRAALCDALKVAEWRWVVELGRQPRCAEKMRLQIVRLVPSSREFIRDDDNLAFSRKGSTDAMKRLGLLKDDRREWLDAKPIYQDVSPTGRPLTVFFLWPAAADLFTGVESARSTDHPVCKRDERAR